MADGPSRAPPERLACATGVRRRGHTRIRAPRILDELSLGPTENLLDVGCGDGILLRDALATGASATGLEHSEEMVRLARERAPGAQVVLASAEDLPFEDTTFTAVTMSIVFFFLAVRSGYCASVVVCCVSAAAS